MNEATCREVIITDLKQTGSGQNRFSPLRRVVQVYEKDGSLIAEHDPYGSLTLEQLLDFGQYCLTEKPASIEEAFAAWTKANSLCRLV